MLTGKDHHHLLLLLLRESSFVFTPRYRLPPPPPPPPVERSSSSSSLDISTMWDADLAGSGCIVDARTWGVMSRVVMRLATVPLAPLDS